MSLPSRLSRLEGFPFRNPPLDDESVLAAIRSGVVYDPHLQWLDSLFRDAIQINLAMFALGVRLEFDIAADFIAMEGCATAVGTHVLSCRADEPLPAPVEWLLARGLFFVDIPSRDQAKTALAVDGRARAMGQAWLLHRLVGLALGADLGQGIRAALDRVFDRDLPLVDEFTLTPPHPTQRRRMQKFVDAFDIGEAKALLFDDRMSGRISQLSEVGPPGTWT